jgi:pimeloyl-ACP methyl ester carboxylesterase
MSSPIFFAHADGFPSATYGKLFAALEGHHRIVCLEQHGHDPRFPVNDNWSNLVDELLHHLEALGEPVFGIGHSLGGILHYHAALRRPERYRGVVMLDSPLLTAGERLLVRGAKRLGLIDRITPAGRTLGRRETFDDLEHARRYFAGKPLFRDFDPECLDAYLRHALRPTDAGLRLRFDPATEIRIYRSLPHREPGRPGQLRVPLALVRGEQSRTVRPRHTHALRRMRQGECFSLPGGHMFPMERPEQTAALVRDLLRRWSGADGEAVA